ncbi:hypothetical protein MCEMRE203_00311 [Candidatus Nanopelagicaceae bacterium]
MSNQIETSIEVTTTNRDKKTVFWRGILVAPVVVFLWSFTPQMSSELATVFIMFPAVLALVVRGVYPSYVLSFNHALIELETRVIAYALFLTDDYPSIERNPKISVVLPEINGGAKLNRFLPLVKWLLAIPLYLVGLIYATAALFVSLVAWFSTWSTGIYPTWALDIVVKTISYWNRIYGYAFLLVTDEYPSFAL